MNQPVRKNTSKFNKKKLCLVLAVVWLFVGLVGGIFYAVKTRFLPFEMGLLLFISLLGMYVGFGILIGAYRLVNKLH